MRLLDDKDIAAVEASVSQVVKNAIGQAANVLVPALAAALGKLISGATVTVGPITIEPIEVSVVFKD